MTTLGSFLRERREALGLTQSEIAQRFDIPQAYLSRIESGRTKLPNAELRARIAEALKVSPLEILLKAGEISTVELEEWASRVGYRRSTEEYYMSLAEQRALARRRTFVSSPLLDLLRKIPLLTIEEVRYLLIMCEELPTEGRKTREKMGDQSAEYSRWLEISDVMTAL